MRRLLGGVGCLTVLIFGALMNLCLTQAAAGFADPTFQQRWQQDEASVPNFWGPLATASDKHFEPYGDPRATGSNRLVQYFDKGRMEIGNPGVTSGLLATELITGQIQTGDTMFEPKPSPRFPSPGMPTIPAPPMP